VGEIRSFGLLAAIEIVKDKETKTRFDPVGRAASLVRDHAIANGLMMRAVNDTMILSPPLIWTKETIDMACERIARALDLAARDLRGT
ncbi:MAG: aspartate aminotransferase family protein, partial [Nitratireductor sp.]